MASFFLFGYSSSAQLPDSVYLAEAITYTSLSEALKTPEKVYKLSLRKNKLEVFPEDILLLTNLRFLDLSRNKIIEIPPGINKLILLEELRLSRNKIEVIPKEVMQLLNLRGLYLNQNYIAALPVEIGNLIKLETLDLWSNDLVGFPDELEKLKNLKKLDLRVILIDDKEQKRIKELLPNTKIHFSPGCNCGY